MLSYHSNPDLKTQDVEAAKRHREQDMLLSGTYGRMNGHFRGCSVGCDYYDITHNNPDDVSDNYHKVVAEHYGLPEWLVRLRDHLFEALPEPDRFDFHVQLKEATPVGVDMEPVKHRLTVARMNRLIELQSSSDYEPKYEVIAALEGVRRCAEAELGGNQCDWSAARSAAESATESAARSAELAAWSAELAAWSAAWSAAESATESAARSAELAAESAAARSAAARSAAARSAAAIAERDTLLSILRGMEDAA